MLFVFVVHLKAPAAENSPFMADYKSSTLKDAGGAYRILIGQLLIQTPDFGVGGDSGACVYAESGDGDVFPVGVFVGKFNDKTKFVVSPAEIMMLKGYEWTNAFV